MKKINDKCIISFCIPCYKYDTDKLIRCLDSILNCGMSTTNYEVIVVDDGDTEEIKKSLINTLTKYKYKTWLESKHNKMDRRFCNELFNDVYHQFQSQSPVIIIDQITNFFQIDYTLFYQNLDVSTKNLLYRNLKQRINCDTFIRIKQREMKQQTGGCIQPSFKK